MSSGGVGRRRPRHGACSGGTTTNGDIAELLAQAADGADGHLRRAFRRAARMALSWPVEAADVPDLTELRAVGPYLARVIRGWLDAGATAPEPPPLRRDFTTLAEARRVLADDPTWAPRLRGDLQVHTTWSDGTAGIAEMAAAAQARGHAYVAITDHSKGLRIAHGLDEARLLAQEEEIAATNATLGGGCTLLRATEMNLSPTGAGDLEPSALARLDIVLGAFHSALRRTDDQTDRYVAALRNPHVHVLAHPRGRIWNFRAGLTADWPRVFGVAAELDKAVEIDAFPDRQDLSPGLLEQARAAGVRISLGSDAHAPYQLGAIEIGLALARRASIEADRVVNFLPRAALLAWTASLRA